MSQNRGNNRGRQAAYDKNRNRNTDSRRSRSMYVDGNTVRKIEPQEKPVKKKSAKQTPSKKSYSEVRKNRDKANYMSAGYVLFLTGALCAAIMILVNYIQLQAQLTALTRTIATKESELNYKKLFNDEEYNRIINSIDLEEIRRIAIGELGMTYAQEEQIINYENEGSDYMRQVTEGSK